MLMSLAPRQKVILKVIIDRYILDVVPVASKTIADSCGLKISPATIRNEVASLEVEGYITHPHHSAGSIPTDEAYRHYARLVAERSQLSSAEQLLLYQLLRSTGGEIEQWLKLAATILSRFVHNLAVVTLPKMAQCRLKHLDLISLHDFAALVVLVLYEANIKKQVISFNRRVSQDDLTRVANRINAAYIGKTSIEVTTEKLENSLLEKEVTKSIIDILDSENKSKYGRPYIEGLYQMLSQPEFSNSSTIVRVLELMDREDWLQSISCPNLNSERIEIIIGQENTEEALQDLSLVIRQYGIPGSATGIIGVLGPKRMDYAKTIPSVNYLSSVLSKSITKYI